MTDVNVWAEDPALGVITNDVNVEVETFIAGEGQTVFTLTTFAVTDSKALAAFRNGIREYEGADNSWELSSTTSVTFTEGLAAGDKVQFVLNTIEADPALEISASEVIDDDTISLQNRLDAFLLPDIEALRAITGDTHGEIARLLGSTYPLLYYWDAFANTADDSIAVITPNDIAGAGRWILYEPPFMNTLEEIFLTGAPIAAKLIFLGDVTIGDTSGGIFYWNPATVKSSANGTNIVDPSVSRAAQGTGTGVGCYIRVNTF